eukprot:sb/3474999/
MSLIKPKIPLLYIHDPILYPLQEDEEERLAPALPSMAMDGDHYTVAKGIRPEMHLTRIEVLTWGVRNMKKFQLAAITCPSIEIECGGAFIATNKIKNCKRNPNFEKSSMFFDVVSVFRGRHQIRKYWSLIG